MPSVTKVVILNWNGRAHLERFLPSVVRYTPPDVEIVVADNGSDDDSLDYVGARFPTVVLLRQDRNYGYAEGYNRALAMIEADHYILLNSDIEVTEGWCDGLTARLESDERIAAVAPKLLAYTDRLKFEYAGASGGFIDWLGYPFCRGRILQAIEPDLGQYDDAREVFWASGACMAVRSDVFRSLGGFDAKFFAHMEEIDLCWRAQLAGYRVMVDPASVVYHLGGGTLPNNTPRKISLNYRNNLAMLHKNLSVRSRGFVLFVRMVLDGASALVFLAQGKHRFFRAVWDAHRDYYRWLPQLREQRAALQAGAVARSGQIYRGFIILRYLLGRRRFGRMM